MPLGGARGTTARKVIPDDPDLIVDAQRVGGRVGRPRLVVFSLHVKPTEVHAVSRAGIPPKLEIARDPRSFGEALRRVAGRKGIGLHVTEPAEPSLCRGFHSFPSGRGLPLDRWWRRAAVEIVRLVRELLRGEAACWMYDLLPAT